MKEVKKMGSIAGRLNRTWLRKLLWIFFLLDAVIFSVAAFQIGGEDIFYDYNALLTELRFLYGPVLLMEGAVLFFNLLFGKGKIRRKLRPLYEMARTTQTLSQAARLDEERFHNLEDAISRLSPTRPDARLHTGNTELRGLETAVNDLLERMRESYRQQSRFVSDASHELRTPIAVIQGYVNMLDRWGKEDEKILTESIAAIQSESEHMKKLVEQLLFLARGESGKTQLTFQRFSLSQLICEVYEESAMIDSDHIYELSDPGGVFAWGDESMIKQTVRILVDNAAKYSPSGESICLRAGMKEGGIPCFVVQDSGVGINSQDVSHVFERFYRSDSSRTRGTGGTGLGLSIAKWIIDKHGGHFEILSREGLGTRITVNLPVKEDTAGRHSGK